MAGLKETLAQIPTEEVAQLRKFLRGGMSRYSGPYGFTSRHIMVRGRSVNIWDMDNPVGLARVRKALGMEAHDGN